MIASVQYNDIVGTAAADVSDFYYNSLQEFLVDTYTSFDGERYSCRGCSAFFGGRNQISVSFICLDKNNGDFVKFTTSEWWTPEEFFNLFKRFEVVLGKDMEEIHVDEANEQLLLTNDSDE